MPTRPSRVTSEDEPAILFYELSCSGSAADYLTLKKLTEKTQNLHSGDGTAKAYKPALPRLPCLPDRLLTSLIPNSTSSSDRVRTAATGGQDARPVRRLAKMSATTFHPDQRPRVLQCGPDVSKEEIAQLLVNRSVEADGVEENSDESTTAAHAGENREKVQEG